MTLYTADQLRKLYHTSRWMRRARAYRRLHPICATPGCAARATVVDHIVPRSTARDDAELHRLTWDFAGNVQSLCARCHALKTNRELWGDRRRARPAPPAAPSSSSIVTRDYTKKEST